MPATQPTQVPGPLVPEPLEQSQSPAETDQEDLGEGASKREEIAATATVNWENNLPRLSTGDLIGSGVHVSAPSTDGMTIAIADSQDLATQILLDQSVAVFLDGEFALGISAPRSPDAPANAWTWERTSGHGHIQFTAVRRSNLNEDTELSVFLGETAVEFAQWVQEPEGSRLFITPGSWAREGGLVVSEHGWRSVVRDVPEVAEYAGQSLEHQFQCHAIGAQSKDTWNLETWYDDIGLLSLLAARCNP